MPAAGAAAAIPSIIGGVANIAGGLIGSTGAGSPPGTEGLQEAAMQAGQLFQQYGGLARADLNYGLTAGLRQTAPYREAGLRGLDEYLGTLGMAPTSKEQQIVDQMNELMALNQQIQYSAGRTAGFGDTVYSGVTNQQYVNQQLQSVNSLVNRLKSETDPNKRQQLFDQINTGFTEASNRINNLISADPGRADAAELRKIQSKIQDVGTTFTQIITPELPQAPTGLSSAQKFLETPEAKLLYGDYDITKSPEENYLASSRNILFKGYDPTKSVAENYLTGGENILFKGYDPSKSVGENFLADPTQKAIYEQVAQNLNRSASARGYLDSPRLQQEMSLAIAGQLLPNYMSALYGATEQYRGQLSGQLAQTRGELTNSFRQYQSNLAHLSGLGATMSGSAQQAYLGTGAGLADIQTQIGTQLANAQLAAAQAQYMGAMNQYNARQQQTAGIGGAIGQFGSLFSNIMGGR